MHSVDVLPAGSNSRERSKRCMRVSPFCPIEGTWGAQGTPKCWHAITELDPGLGSQPLPRSSPGDGSLAYGTGTVLRPKDPAGPPTPPIVNMVPPQRTYSKTEKRNKSHIRS